MDEQRRLQAERVFLRRSRALGLVVAGLLLIGLGSGCSAEKRYKTLSFFFDGVPDPNAPAVAEGDEGGVPGAAPRSTGYMHKPFADNQCNACHSGDTSKFESFSKVPPTVCAKCHAAVPRQYAVMHGPVAAGECLFCHSPHESAVPALLNRPSPAVCVQCHDRELLSDPPAEHLDRARSCLDCHVGHGGDKRMLLRAGVTLSTLPASRPSGEPDSDRGEGQ